MEKDREISRWRVVRIYGTASGLINTSLNSAHRELTVSTRTVQVFQKDILNNKMLEA